MLCKQCGNDIPTIAKFCPKCGQATTSLYTEGDKPVWKNSKVVVLALLIIIIIGAFLKYYSDNLEAEKQVQILAEEKKNLIKVLDEQERKKRITMIEEEEEKNRIRMIEEDAKNTILNARELKRLVKFPAFYSDLEERITFQSNGNTYEVSIKPVKIGWLLTIISSNGVMNEFNVDGERGELYSSQFRNEKSVELLYITHGGNGNAVRDFAIIGLENNSNFKKLVDMDFLRSATDNSGISMYPYVSGYKLILKYNKSIPSNKSGAREYYTAQLSLIWNGEKQSFSVVNFSNSNRKENKKAVEDLLH